MIFPKAEAVTEIEQLATKFRAALFRLDMLSNCASLLEIGTLRRELNAVRTDITNNLEGVDDDG